MRTAKTLVQLLVTIVGIAMCSASMLVLVANEAASDTVHAVDLAADRPMVNPAATLDTTQVDDARDIADTGIERADAAAEGQDVLTLAYDPAPADLWNALTADHPQWYDETTDDAPGHGLFYVPVGTVIDVPGGLYLATLDGWSVCRDLDSTQECNANSPTTPVAAPDTAPVQTVAHVTTPRTPHRFTADERKAARLILTRLRWRALPVYEDWTWQGMPRVVAEHSDALLDAAQAAGLHGNDWPWSKAARMWLAQIVATGRG